MEEDEIFNEFYAKLMDIGNFAFNLGESIAESKIVRKILRSLPERFHAKITAIEEVKDIDQDYCLGLGEKNAQKHIHGFQENISEFLFLSETSTDRKCRVGVENIG